MPEHCYFYTNLQITLKVFKQHFKLKLFNYRILKFSGERLHYRMDRILRILNSVFLLIKLKSLKLCYNDEADMLEQLLTTHVSRFFFFFLLIEKKHDLIFPKLQKNCIQLCLSSKTKNFQGGGGQEPTFCLKKQQQKYNFSQKSLKTYYFWPAQAGQGGGGRAPLPPPRRPPMPFVNFAVTA